MTAIKMIVLVLVIMIILAVGLVFFTLQRNGARLFEKPGFAKRLSTYLTTNIAETADNSAFPELRTPVFNVSAETLYQRVLFVAAKSGWAILASDSDNLSTKFVVRTPIFLFKDDVLVQVRVVNTNESSLYVRSSSRTGKADFAANARHIQTLLKALAK